MGHFIPWHLYMRYNALTGVMQTIVSKDRHPSCVKGKLNALFVEVDGVVFASITLSGVTHRMSAGRLAHLLHVGILPDREPIYINGIASDLRWVNMRFRDIGFVTGPQATTNARVKPLSMGAEVLAAFDPPEGFPPSPIKRT